MGVVKARQKNGDQVCKRHLISQRILQLCNSEDVGDLIEVFSYKNKVAVCIKCATKDSAKSCANQVESVLESLETLLTNYNRSYMVFSENSGLTEET